MIRLREFGRPHNKTSLFAIPGIDGSIGSIEPIVNLIARHRQVVVVDYSAEDNLTLEALATEIAEHIRSRDVGAIDIIGQSIGSVLAAHVASMHQLSVRKVILSCTFTKLRWRVLRLSNVFLRVTPGWIYRMTTRPTMTLVCGPVGDGTNHPFFEASKNSDKAGVIKRTSWQINRDFGDDLVKIDSPCLILMGAKDRFVPNAEKEVEKLQKLFMGSPIRIVPIPEAGHVRLRGAGRECPDLGVRQSPQCCARSTGHGDSVSPTPARARVVAIARHRFCCEPNRRVLGGVIRWKP